MNIRLIPVLLIFVCVVVGCRKTATAPSAPAPPSVGSTPPVIVQGGATPALETKHFKGSIGSSLDLQMKLVRIGDQLSGSYFYQRVGTRINLRGAIEPGGNFQLDEFDQAGKQTGLFKGLWAVNADDGLITLAGNWSKPPGDKGGDKKTAFSLHEQPISLSGDVELVSKQV